MAKKKTLNHTGKQKLKERDMERRAAHANTQTALLHCDWTKEGAIKQVMWSAVLPGDGKGNNTKPRWKTRARGRETWSAKRRIRSKAGHAQAQTPFLHCDWTKAGVVVHVDGHGEETKPTWILNERKRNIDKDTKAKRPFRTPVHRVWLSPQQPSLKSNINYCPLRTNHNLPHSYSFPCTRAGVLNVGYVIGILGVRGRFLKMLQFWIVANLFVVYNVAYLC